MQSALEDLPVDGTSYAVSEGISHRSNGQPSHPTRILSHTSSIPEMDQHQGGLNPSTSRMNGNDDGSREIVHTLLETAPTIGFFKFLDGWLESRGLKSVGTSCLLHVTVVCRIHVLYIPLLQNFRRRSWKSGSHSIRVKGPVSKIEPGSNSVSDTLLLQTRRDVLREGHDQPVETGRIGRRRILPRMRIWGRR